MEEQSLSLNSLINDYLEQLDSWQRDVDNIRNMHHEVWKGTRVSPIIRQHRAGSRVEKQTRILPMGQQTDMDYMFEVVGIEVNCNNQHESMYFKQTLSYSSSSACGTQYDISNAFGKIYASKSYAASLERHDSYAKLFTDAFKWDMEECAFLLIPHVFKQNVVKHCGLEYKKETDPSALGSPSVAGYGAVNEYDGVPCLKLSEWPQPALYWRSRSQNHHEFSMLDIDWKTKIVDSVPLFVVLTGNPTSERQTEEFRLSFSMVEIACFDKFNSEVRKAYGILKYIFKRLFSDFKLLSSYHIKTLMMWQAEEISANQWRDILPLQFIHRMLDLMLKCVREKNVPHFFLDNCNIFPIHKFTDDAYNCYEREYTECSHKLSDAIGSLIRSDLNVPYTASWVDACCKIFDSLLIKGRYGYVTGYLTRLLSVTTFSISENFAINTSHGMRCVDEITTYFSKYENDANINRIAPMVNSCIRRFGSDSRLRSIRSRTESDYESFLSDKLSRQLHSLFEEYVSGLFPKKWQLSKLNKYIPSSKCNAHIGISITKYHSCLVNDVPICSMIELLKADNEGKCPRVYLDPELLLHHLCLQVDFLDTHKELDLLKFQGKINALSSIVQKLSIKEPYLGKLSFQYAGVYLLRAYRHFVETQGISIHITIPDLLFNQRASATNFNLR